MIVIILLLLVVVMFFLFSNKKQIVKKPSRNAHWYGPATRKPPNSYLRLN